MDELDRDKEDKTEKEILAIEDKSEKEITEKKDESEIEISEKEDKSEKEILEKEDKSEKEILEKEDKNEKEISDKEDKSEKEILETYALVPMNGEIAIKSEVSEEEEELNDVEPIIKFPSSPETDVPEDIELPYEKVKILRGHDTDAYVCSWHPISDILLSGSEDTTACIWNLNYYKDEDDVNLTVLKHTDSEEKDDKDVTCLEWDPSGSLLATATYDGSTRVWYANGELKSLLGWNEGPVIALKWNKKGNYLATASLDKTSTVWDVEEKTLVQRLSLHDSAVLDVDWKTDDIYATCGTDRLIHVCKVDSDEPLKTFKGHEGEVNSVRWDPQGVFLASCANDFTVKVWSMESDNQVFDVIAHTKEIYSIKWSPTGPGTDNPNSNVILASGGFDCSVRLWNVENCDLIHSLDRHTLPVYSIDFSPDGQLIASGSFDKRIYIWSTKTGELVRSYLGTDGIFEVAWNHKGDKLGASSVDGNIFVLDLRS